MNEFTTRERTRTFSWGDPLISARAAPTMGGLEYLQAIGRGELPAPPIMLLLNIGFQSATDRAGKLYAHATSTCLIMRPPAATERSQ